MGNKPRIRFKGFTEDWEQRKLGEIGKWYKGIGGTKDDLNTKQSGRMFVHYADLYQTSEFLSNVVHWTINEIIGALIAPNSILFPMSDVTPYGLARTTSCKLKDVRAGGDVLINTIDTNIDSDFVSIYINLFSKNILPFVTGTTVKHINSKSLSELTILIPSFEEQVKIVNLVKFYNEIITLHQCKLEKLKLTKKALLQKLFPKNGKHIPEIRFKGFTDAWEQRKLSELATMNARIGWQNLRTSEFLDSGDYLLITGTDFDNGRIKYGTCHYVEKKRFDQDTKIQLSTGSILITKDGTLGKVALVEELPKPATLNAGVFNVRVKDDAVLSYKYLYHYLKAPFLMKYVTANATGGTIKHLNQSILVDFPIPITEKLEQDRIAKLLDSLELSITLHQRKLERLQEVKKGLLQKMFV